MKKRYPQGGYHNCQVVVLLMGTILNVCIQIRDVVKLLQEHFQISFEEAVLRFYKSETYKTLQETENGLWAESAEYIADRYYEETAG